jgi:hypothetical protein
MLTIHIAAGGLALLLGAIALTVRKGGMTHRRSGLLFVHAMLAMGLTAALLGNAGGGLMAAYFVITAWMTVRPLSRWTRATTIGAMSVAVLLGAGSILGGVRAFNSPGRALDGVPFVMHLFIAAVLLTSAAGDVRVLRSGALRGRPRLARHLWRMCFALFVAAGSFFSIRERVAAILPAPFTSLPMRMLPILLVFVVMFYWLWRLRGRPTMPGRAGDGPITMTAGVE